ncbi:MAG: GAF domain-containing sensor histidine kinase [Chloroflexi bacterium]|nr:GAF domain-containing sensor histidine kinase [Chloroflexota bacterium]
MPHSLDCPHCAKEGPALRAMSDAVLAIAGELSMEGALKRIVDVARDLVDARYAALGVPDGHGGFAQFITSGLTDEEIAAIGPLPRSHGLLDALLRDPEPYRWGDVQTDSRYQGWPDTHPDMHSLLGVPIVARGDIIAAFYLTDKEGSPEFSDEDQHLIELLAAHAAITIENARLYERSRELSVVEERNRLARDLHDSVSQTLFSANLVAEAAVTLIDRDPAQAKVQVAKLQDLVQGAVGEMRSLVFELRSADIDTDGLAPTLQKHIDVVRRVYHTKIELEVSGERRFNAALEQELFRIAQEALNNCLKHAQAEQISLSLDMTNERVALTVRDDGAGFDPSDPRLRSKRLGLTSMRERAESIGATLRIESAPGAGTVVMVEVPLG